MRKHIDYFYKCYDKKSENEQDRICREYFNEYGYNFDSNKRRVIDPDGHIKKKNYQESMAIRKQKEK